MRKRSQAYHAQTQEEYQQLMQEDDIAQKRNECIIHQEKTGIVDQIEWLETPDFIENDSKYKLELNTSSDSDESFQTRKKFLIIIEDSQQLNEYFSKENYPHLFSDNISHKILELVYSSQEEEMWVHFRPLHNSPASASNSQASASAESSASSFSKKREESSQFNIKNSLYCSIIEDSFYPHADYIILFSSEQAKQIQDWKLRCRNIKPSQKICVYSKQKQTLQVENEYDQNECDTSISTLSSPPSSAELGWFNNLKVNNNKEEFILLEQPSESYNSYNIIKTLINQA
ncbi:hypothetical protein ABPG74_017129 [Tetrahymena malaccensis]